MSIPPTSKSSSLLSNEQSDRSSTNTLSLFENSIFNNAHNAFEVHLDKGSVQQSILDRCLMSGFQIVQNRRRELSQVAPTLQLLLKFGAQLINGALLENENTPYHLICQSSGDHHELLNLMLLSSGRVLFDTEDCINRTALVYAIQNGNINCVKSLLKNGANVNHYIDSSRNCLPFTSSPLVIAMAKLDFNSEHLAIMQADIFDLLLAYGAYVNLPCDILTPPPILRALYFGNVECMKKLIQRGARLGMTPYGGNYVWAKLVRQGNVEVLKCVIEHGINKDSTDTKGKSMLRLVIESGDEEAVRYLLDLGVTLPIHQPKAELKPCKKCGTNRLYLERHYKQTWRDPCMVVVNRNALDVFKMLEKHGPHSYNSFYFLREAIDSPDVIEYLLNKYTYPLDIEYTTNYDNVFLYQSCYRTILMDACYSKNVDVVKMLLDHGADPNKRMCEKKCFSVINIAIRRGNVKMVAHLIRSGLDINSRSYHYVHGYVLPFEAAVLDSRFNAAKMFLVSGGSCGLYSLNTNHDFKADTKPDPQKIIKTWKVDSNNVNPLEQQCRRVILNHLSPQAHKKIQKLPLPHLILKYLSIPELDDMINVDLIYSTLLSIGV